MADFDRLFGQFRETPWKTDPNGVPQEGLPGNGNPESTGWIADDAITADTIQANAITAGKIDADAVTAREIAANTVTANEIAANTITANEIAANTITANEIAANTITANEVAANTITANEIAANTITASEIAANAVTADEIAANTITAGEIAASAITANELAANSVETNHIVAGNVTSGKIELTISGKNFGANDGSAAAPGVYFDADGSTGMYRNSSSSIAFSAGGTDRLRIGPFIEAGGHFAPRTAGGYDIGSDGFGIVRWDTVYCNFLDQVSDERLKTDITDTPLGLDFVKLLKPRAYRWRDTSDFQARSAVQVDEDALRRECHPYEKRIQWIRAQQRQGRIADADAEREVAEIRQTLDAIRGRHLAPVEEAQRKRRPGKRLHHGLIAQEVKAALDAAGVDAIDAALWKEAPDGEQSLGYSGFIAPLVRAVQELSAEVEALKARTGTPRGSA